MDGPPFPAVWVKVEFLPRTLQGNILNSDVDDMNSHPDSAIYQRGSLAFPLETFLRSPVKR